MKPLILEMQAFGAYAGKQHLDFNDLKGRKFFLIHGATGAGKTTILDAICYALYGSAASDLREAKALRSDHAPADLLTSVTFIFSLADDVYKVCRLPRQLRQKKRGGEGFTEQQPEATLWRLENGTEVLLEAKYENVTRKITDLLGFQCHQFRQVVLLPQGEFRKLLVAKSDERQQIMQTLFKTELYERIEEYLKKKAKDKLAEIKLVYEQKNWHLAESGIDSLPQLIEAVADLTKAVAASQNNLVAVKERYQQGQQQLNRAKELDRQFAEYATAQQVLQLQEAKKPQIAEISQQLALLEQAAKLTEAEKNVKRLQLEVQKYQEQEFCQKAIVAKEQAACQVAEAKFNAASNKETERQQLESELAQIAQYQEQARLLQKATSEVQSKQNEVAKAQQQAMLIDQKMVKLQARIVELTSCQQKSFSSATTMENYKLQLSVADRIINKHQQLTKLKADGVKLAKNLQIVTQELANVNKQRTILQQELENAQHLFTIGQAGILAQNLRERMPCPVCGSTEHPQLATMLAALPTEATLEALQVQLAKLDKQREIMMQTVSAKQNQVAMITQQSTGLAEELGDAAQIPLPTLQEQVAQLSKAYEQSKIAADNLATIEQKLADCKQSEQRGLIVQKTAQEAYQRVLSELAALQAVVAEREQLLPADYRVAGTLNKRMVELTARVSALKAELQTAQQSWQSKKEHVAASLAAFANIKKNMHLAEQSFLKEKFNFYKTVKVAGFSDFADYVKLQPAIAGIEEVRGSLQSFAKDLAIAQERCKRAAQAVAGLDKPDLNVVEQQYEAAGKLQQEAIADNTRLKLALNKQQHSLEKITVLEAQLMKMQTENGVLAKLYQVTRGDNKYSMNLQRFVLASLLERVTEAANIMLKTMSKSRYLLQRTNDVARKGSASGLDLEVFDNNTGVARSVATLSGGETFLASLALALGLADVVQQYAGGIRLDTIFVDEGFGTLDPESLDMALNTLISLQNSGRLVGIISHVPELQERIDARLEVKVGKRGSWAEFHVG